MNDTPVAKIELHCHIDGIVDPTMLRELQRQGYPLPISPETLAAAYPVSDYAGFVQWLKVADPLEGDSELIKRILALHLERLKTQNVVYTEIMLGTSELPRDPGRLVEGFQEFRDYVTGLEEGKIQVEFLVAFSRDRPPEMFDKLAYRLLKLYEAHLIVGVAVAGPERGHPVKPFHKTLVRLREAGLGIEVHAGEWAGPESVWDALEHGVPHRIGHGVALFDDPRLIERFQEAQIHVEMCPTSNVKTGSVARIEAHPVGRARQLGLNFGVNTDDPGAFECSMDSEYRLLAETFGFQTEDFEKINDNALAARFQPELRYLASPPGPLRVS